MMLLVLMSIMTYGKADPARHKYELGFPFIGKAEALRGGVSHIEC